MMRGVMNTSSSVLLSCLPVFLEQMPSNRYVCQTAEPWSWLRARPD